MLRQVALVGVDNLSLNQKPLDGVFLLPRDESGQDRHLRHGPQSDDGQFRGYCQIVDFAQELRR